MDAEMICINGARVLMTPANTEYFTLEEMQGIVGGLIEFVYLDDNRIMVVNEEGLLLHLGLNSRASKIAGRLIVGNVMVCDNSQIR